MSKPIFPPGLRGHTLAELLVVLALAAVLAGLAMPAFAGLLHDSRRDAAVHGLLHAVHTARQLAALRGEEVRLCGSMDRQRCSGSADWSGGLLLTDAAGTVWRNQPAAEAAPRLRSNRTSISFEAGTSFATPATIVVCDRRGPAAARAVIVSRSGRPRASDRDASNRPLQC
ncbi:MAG: prepilin-type N-terminal cleavage/methylation domain-containing protein [Gammaproteobacteria bacterium]|nr:prepilin-type N-terminal cleavage/methylation domain-containing protein [Gammaproteobacteria bacterium]